MTLQPEKPKYKLKGFYNTKKLLLISGERYYSVSGMIRVRVDRHDVQVAGLRRRLTSCACVSHLRV